jgi:hypothetical protein
MAVKQPEVTLTVAIEPVKRKRGRPRKDATNALGLE